MMKKNLLLIFLILFFGSSLSSAELNIKSEKTGGAKMRLSSSAFSDNGMIPSRYARTGSNISPPLAIQDIPANAKSLALAVDDPDSPSGTWGHWVVWNIPPDTKSIPEGTQPKGVKGRNDFGRLEWDGPSPPSGTHTYVFKIYALDILLNLKEGAGKKDMEKAMEGHIFAKAVLKGKFSR
ncbi:MAG: YbhB/YbcL family Raf kinase inhibitor-like protein [bacterium]|nr:YbhB/YbcL family Raf kinase inhibitor-like protein [bacterium]